MMCMRQNPHQGSSHAQDVVELFSVYQRDAAP